MTGRINDVTGSVPGVGMAIGGLGLMAAGAAGGLGKLGNKLGLRKGAADEMTQDEQGAIDVSALRRYANTFKHEY